MFVSVKFKKEEYVLSPLPSAVTDNKPIAQALALASLRIKSSSRSDRLVDTAAVNCSILTDDVVVVIVVVVIVVVAVVDELIDDASRLSRSFFGSCLSDTDKDGATNSVLAKR